MYLNLLFDLPSIEGVYFSKDYNDITYGGIHMQLPSSLTWFDRFLVITCAQGTDISYSDSPSPTDKLGQYHMKKPRIYI